MASVHSSPGEIPATQYFVPKEGEKKLSPFHPIHSYKSTCISKKKKKLNSHMDAKVGVHQILHLQPPVDVTSNMQFKTKLANQRRVGAKITKENCHSSCSLSFLKSEYVSCPQVFLAGCIPRPRCVNILSMHG